MPSLAVAWVRRHPPAARTRLRRMSAMRGDLSFVLLTVAVFWLLSLAVRGAEKL